MALDYKLIGERLRKARLARHLTQENVCDKMNITMSYLSRLETGYSHINLDRLAEICSVLGVTEGEVLNGVKTDSRAYLSSDFMRLLDECPVHKQRIIYKIAKIILEDA